MNMRNISNAGGLPGDNAGGNMDDDNNEDLDLNQNGDDSGEYDPLADMYGDDEDSGFDLGEDFDDEDADGEDDPDESGSRNKQRAPAPDPNKAMIAEINGVLDAISLDADAIPEDFDPSNPKQFREVVAKAQKQAVITAMQLMTKPIQQAMAQANTAMIAEMQKMMKRTQATSKIEAAFEELTPIIGNNKKVMAFAKDNFMRSYRVTKDLNKSLKATKQILKQIGYEGGTRRSNNPFDMGSDSRTGAAALDSFLPVQPRQRR